MKNQLKEVGKKSSLLDYKNIARNNFENVFCNHISNNTSMKYTFFHMHRFLDFSFFIYQFSQEKIPLLYLNNHKFCKALDNSRLNCIYKYNDNFWGVVVVKAVHDDIDTYVTQWRKTSKSEFINQKNENWLK